MQIRSKIRLKIIEKMVIVLFLYKVNNLSTIIEEAIALYFEFKNRLNKVLIIGIISKIFQYLKVKHNGDFKEICYH